MGQIFLRRDLWSSKGIIKYCVKDEFHEIKALQADILASVGKPGARQPVLAEFLERRRYGLLAKHLGFTPQDHLPLLYVVGDSHVVFFAGAENIVFHKGRRVWTRFLRARYVSAFTELLPVFRVFHIGPATAWQADELGSSTKAREKIDTLVRRRDLPPGARVLLVFGEIDIRCHLPKAILAGKRLEQAVDAAAMRFLRLPLRLRELGLQPAVWLPTVTPDFGDAENPENIQALPVVGSQSLRDEIRDAYCEILATYCIHSNFPCAGLVPPDSIAPEHRFIDRHHLSQRLMPAALATLIKSGILPLVPATNPFFALSHVESSDRL